MLDNVGLRRREVLRDLGPDLLSKKVCYLTGEDVVDFLDRQGLLEQLTAEQIAQFIEYADKKLDPSWEEELESLLDLPGAKIILGAPQAQKEGREMQEGWALAEPGMLGKPAIRDKIKAVKMANNPGQSLGRKNGKERGEIE